MRHVDALSPVASVRVIGDSTMDRIRRAQTEDPELPAINAMLQGEEPYEDFHVKSLSGLLYKAGAGKNLLVVPQGLERELVRQAHETGHFRAGRLWSFSPETTG